MSTAHLEFAHRIAKCAINHYDQVIPSNNGGKPQSGREWTVYAAIVACRSLGNGECDTSNDIDGHHPQQNPEMWVVSCATGSKCTSIRSIVSSFPSPNSSEARKRKQGKMRPQLDMDEDSICQCYNGMILKDSHAEALARRGLMACLWDEIEHSLQLVCSEALQSVEKTGKDNQSRHLLEVDKSSTNADVNRTVFQIKKNISFHLYVSDSPCGDATIYEVRKRPSKESLSDDTDKADKDTKDTELNFTGAKIILSGYPDKHKSENGSITSILTCSAKKSSTGDMQQSSVTIGREDTQQLGALRIKSSRSNIPPELRSTSMSCSDKLVRWGLVGLQGSLLSKYIPEPICLSSICVSKDPRSVDGGTHGGQLVALERALSGRIEGALKSMPEMHKKPKVKPPTIAVVGITYESSKSACEKRYLEAQTNEKEREIEQNLPASCKRTKLNDAQDEAQNSSSHRQIIQQSNQKHSSQDRKTITKKASPCGMSINWHQIYQTANVAAERYDKKATEVTTGATGLKRGKKPKTPHDVLCSASRLSRFSLLQRCMRCSETMQSNKLSSGNADEGGAMTECKGNSPSSESAEPVSYMQYKQTTCLRNGIMECFQGPLAGYVRSGKDDDFLLPQKK